MNSSPTLTTSDEDSTPLREHPKQLPKWLRRIDQTEKATFIIDAWLALDPHTQNTFLAQLIAATIHDGPGTVLERFASTGQLISAEGALSELNDVVVPLEREPWLDMLGRFLTTTPGDRA